MRHPAVAPAPFRPASGIERLMRSALATEERTPLLLLDVEAVREQLARIAQALPGVGLRYAVKACPVPAVLRAVVESGGGFDVASWAETQLALDAGALPQDVSYGHPVKPRAHVAAAFAAGVRDLAVDGAAELHKVAEAAPGSRVHVRVAVDQRGADWPLDGKYGVSPDQARELVRRARELGLDPAGVVFHVGSQQRRPETFAEAVALVAPVVRTEGLRVLNLGGGWPARVLADDPDVAVAGAHALAAARRLLGTDVQLLCEPGRAVAAAAGAVVATVIGTATRGDERWAYLDTGVFHGLVEAEGEVTRYPLLTDAAGRLVPTVLAGPTCDSTDVLYRRVPPYLPEGLQEGDRVVLGGAGAYTASYSTVGFNGFPPLRVVASGSGRDVRSDEDVRELPVVGVGRAVVQPA